MDVQDAVRAHSGCTIVNMHAPLLPVEEADYGYKLSQHGRRQMMGL